MNEYHVTYYDEGERFEETIEGDTMVRGNAGFLSRQGHLSIERGGDVVFSHREVSVVHAERVDRHYYQVAVVDVSSTAPAEPVEVHECDSADELSATILALDELGLEYPREIRVTKMTRLDAPLTDSEEQDIQNWIDGLEPSGPTVEDVEPGRVFHDPNCPHWSKNGLVEVVRLATGGNGGGYLRAFQHTIEDDVTVSDMNPDCPSGDPVVIATYVEANSGTEYAFPISRLEFPEGDN